MWATNQLQERQIAAEFASMDADAQRAWTAEDDKLIAESDAFTAKLKNIMGYADEDCTA